MTQSSGYETATSGTGQTTSSLPLLAVFNDNHKHPPMTEEKEFSISGGLVEIAALTALIGGPTAESLALGASGACGLPWAALSSFGSIYIVKACVSACTPSWLRETIGVRTTGSDAAVGCNRKLDRKANERRMGAEAIGVEVECDKSSRSENVGSTVFHDIYAFDEWTAGPLRSCTALEPGERLRAHFYLRDPQWAPFFRSMIKLDWIYTFATTVKIAEPALLYIYGSKHIYWVTGVTWAYFFLSAIILQLLHLGRAPSSGKQDKCIDIVAGKLPTAQVIGGHRKVLLDVPLNARKHPLWQAMWTGGLIICVSCLIGTYILLSTEPTICFQIWLIFQLLWLTLRSMYFHFAHRTDDMARIITPVVTEKHRPIQVNYRLLGLSVALSKYQMLNHPRGAYCYTDDASDPTVIRNLLDEGSLEFSDRFPLSGGDEDGSIINVSVAAVLGDTLLTSVAWLMGSPLTGMELYDSIILVARISATKTLLVPACRVLSGRIDITPDVDPESTMPSGFMPKGVSNVGSDISWWYWIPCGENKWLHYHTPWTTPKEQNLGVTGKREMMVLSAEGVTEMLERGELLVSLNSIKDVEGVVRQSMAAAEVLKDMMIGRL